MKLKSIFNIKNIASYVEGNAKYFFNQLRAYPPHIQEQVAYRLYKCKDDCVPEGKCKVCECPPKKKAFVNESCNNGERFPNLMNKEDWEKFKNDNGISR